MNIDDTVLAMASHKVYSCSACKKETSSTNDLDCGKHNVCTDCLLKQGTKDYAICQPNDCPGIWIFVDNSNIWIEAKKLQSKVRKFETSEDHRLRIDVGKLADVIASGRPTESGVLYGSEPPPVDTVWEKVRKKGWEVKTKKRSVITGKEKQVDAQIVADVTAKAIKTPIDKRTTIVLVTGDADVIPAIEKVIEEEKWNIEVYMWEQAFSRAIRQFASDNDRVEMKYLDSYLEQFTFTSMMFPIQYHISTKHTVRVVFSMVEERTPDKAWTRKLESIAKWPFQYYWENCTDLVLVFSDDRARRGRFDSKKFLAMIKTDSLKVLTAKTFDEFTAEQGWTTVSSRKTHKWCRSGLNCEYGLECRNEHTIEEKEYFVEKSLYRKVKECFHFRKGHCRKAARDCGYAHGIEDAWCLTCKQNGHYTDECPRKEKC